MIQISNKTLLKNLEGSATLAKHDANVKKVEAEEILSLINAIYKNGWYCGKDDCEGDKPGMNCEGCLYSKIEGIIKTRYQIHDDEISRNRRGANNSRDVF